MRQHNDVLTVPITAHCTTIYIARNATRNIFYSLVAQTFGYELKFVSNSLVSKNILIR